MSPQFTLEDASRLLAVWIAANPKEVEAMEAALERYSKYFAFDNLEHVTSDGFKDFLQYKHNKHWNGIFYYPVYRDMDRLRQCLRVLLNEADSIETRLDRIVPKGGPPFIKGLNRAVLTAVLMCAHPDKYAVYNRKSDEALTLLSLNEAKAKDSFAKRYLAINSACHEIGKSIGQPLHLVDHMFALVLDDVERTSKGTNTGPDSDDESDDDFLFTTEANLEDFIVANWSNTPLARKLGLELHKDSPEDEDESAKQYDTGIGRIDILARDRSKNWVVIELKKGKGGQNAVGQTLKYMGWIKANKATGDETVRGIIITGCPDDKMQYALSMAQNISSFTHELRFELTEQPLPSDSRVD
jgi:hypothetical protein